MNLLFASLTTVSLALLLPIAFPVYGVAIAFCVGMVQWAALDFLDLLADEALDDSD